VPVLLGPKGARLKAVRFLLLSWICNFVGAVFVVYIIGHYGDWFSSGAPQKLVRQNAVKKCNLKWSVAFVRGIGANWLVCLAWWQAISCQDTVSKILSVWWPVFTFTAIGFEHCIANMFYVDIGLVEGANATFGEFVGRNLVPVSLGNFVGGALFLGVAQYVTYSKANELQHTGAGYHAIGQGGYELGRRNVNN
jgi:formate/nitrite transporter